MSKTPAVTLRSTAFLLAENFDSRVCPHCNEATSVFALMLPPGFQRLNTDGGDKDGQWETCPDDPVFLDCVTYLPDSVARAIHPWTDGDYRLDNHEDFDEPLWCNHCHDCGALLDDFEDHHEGGGAFFPITEEQARRVLLRQYFEQPFEADAQINWIPLIDAILDRTR